VAPAPENAKGDIPMKGESGKHRTADGRRASNLVRNAAPTTPSGCAHLARSRALSTGIVAHCLLRDHRYNVLSHDLIAKFIHMTAGVHVHGRGRFMENPGQIDRRHSLARQVLSCPSEEADLGIDNICDFGIDRRRSLLDR
jgi:hypothetical protein